MKGKSAKHYFHLNYQIKAPTSLKEGIFFSLYAREFLFKILTALEKGATLGILFLFGLFTRIKAVLRQDMAR